MDKDKDEQKIPVRWDRPRQVMDMHRPSRPLDIKPSPVIPKRFTQPTIETPVVQAVTESKNDGPGFKFYLVFYLVIIFLVLGGGGAYYILKYKPFKHDVAKPTQQVADKSSNIVDDTLGIKFAITKDFAAIDKPSLLKLNQYFVYGFKQDNVDNVSCIISQQKRNPPGGAVAPESLRDGTMKGIKNSFPDVKLQDYQDIMLANGQDAASIIVTYTDTKIAIKERMVVAATDKSVTFAFCTSPTPLYDYYDTKFGPFFDSIELY